MISIAMHAGWVVTGAWLPAILFVVPLGLVERAENAAVAAGEEALGEIGDLSCLIVHRPDDVGEEELEFVQQVLAGRLNERAAFVAVEIRKARSDDFEPVDQEFEQRHGALIAQPLRIVLRPEQRVFHGTVSSDRRRAILSDRATWRQACQRARARGKARDLSTGARP